MDLLADGYATDDPDVPPDPSEIQDEISSEGFFGDE